MLVLTATVTLLVAALALLAPLKRQLRLNSTTLAVAIISSAKTQLGVVAPVAKGGSYRQRVQIVADRLDDTNHLATLTFAAPASTYSDGSSTRRSRLAAPHIPRCAPAQPPS